LGNNTRCQGVAPEDLTEAIKGINPLLDPGATRIINANKGRAVLERQVHYLCYLLGVHLSEASPDYSEVLAEGIYQPAINCAVPRNNTFAGCFNISHTEVSGPVLHEGI